MKMKKLLILVVVLTALLSIWQVNLVSACDPCIELVKTGPNTAEPGETITYHFWVYNCGDVGLYGDAQVYDPVLGTGAIWSGPLDIGDSAVFDETFTLPDECEDFTNTASAGASEYPEIGDESSWTVDVICPPPCEGCTLTQGYWKTHSKYGPAPSDTTWEAKAGGDAEFFLTGLSYYEVLWTEPRGGNAYYILAHQYIAAELNQLNGACVPEEVQDAMGQAEALLIKYEGALSIPKGGEDRALAIELYELLDDYNNGIIGPGHCSE
jgi:hypothetical protein